MPTQLQLEWPDNRIETFNSLNFLNDLEMEGRGLIFAELYPPLLIRKEELKYVYFKDFSFSGKSVIFSTPELYSISFPCELNFFKISLKLPGK
jgi:hypothetical protein